MAQASLSSTASAEQSSRAAPGANKALTVHMPATQHQQQAQQGPPEGGSTAPAPVPSPAVQQTGPGVVTAPAHVPSSGAAAFPFESKAVHPPPPPHTCCAASAAAASSGPVLSTSSSASADAHHPQPPYYGHDHGHHPHYHPGYHVPPHYPPHYPHPPYPPPPAAAADPALYAAGQAPPYVPTTAAGLNLALADAAALASLPRSTATAALQLLLNANGVRGGSGGAAAPATSGAAGLPFRRGLYEYPAGGLDNMHLVERLEEISTSQQDDSAKGDDASTER